MFAWLSVHGGIFIIKAQLKQEMDKVKKKRKSMSDKYDSDGLPYDQVDKEDNPNGKKRFVWPESLHKDFIAAVFDIGMIDKMAN